MELIRQHISSDHLKTALEWIFQYSKQPDIRLQPEFDIEDDERIYAKKIRELSNFDPEFWQKWLSESGLMELVNQRLSNPKIIKHAAFIKRKCDESFFPLHQDIVLWEKKYESAKTFWIALTEAKRINGGLFYYPDDSELYNHGLDIQYPMFKVISPDTDKRVQWEKIQDIEANAGDILIWSARTAHGSYSNESGQLRVGMPIVFIEESEYLSLNEGKK